MYCIYLIVFLVLLLITIIQCDLWESIRIESINFGQCFNEYSLNLDLCNRTKLEEEDDDNDDAKFYEENCSCDDDCHIYNECCIDKLKLNDFTNYNNNLFKYNWSCVNIPSRYRDMGIYTYQQCSPLWLQASVQKLCLDKPSSILQIIPVYSKSTGIIYRNVFCALCNYDTKHLTKWNLSVICNDYNRTSSLSSDEIANLIIKLGDNIFDSESMMWHLTHNNESFTCRPIIEEFSSYYYMKINYNARACFKAIRDCSLSSSSLTLSSHSSLSLSYKINNIKEKCYSYTHYVYSKEDGKMYRNIYCALCNSIDIESIVCDTNDEPVYGSRLHSKLSLSLSILFDIDNHDCQIKHGQIYDPYKENCVTFFCGKLYHFNFTSKKCEKISNITNNNDNNAIKSDCIKLFLPETEYILLDNFSIIFKKTNHLFNEDEYEHYYIHNRNTAISSASDTSANINNKTNYNSIIHGILICYDGGTLFSVPFLYNTTQEILSFVTLTLSIICLICHLSVHLILPKSSNLPTKILMSLSLSLLIASIFFILSVYNRPTIDSNIVSNERDSIWCIIIAIIIHYSFLSAFTWMNVMAFDVWRSFRLESAYKRLTHSSKLFLIYSLYSWLLPAIIVTISCMLDLISNDTQIKPMYGLHVCWISQKMAMLIFFILPVTLILMVNFIFFGFTAIDLVKQSRNKIKFIHETTTTRRDECNRFYLYIKLAIIMGLAWIFGAIAALSSLQFLWYPFIIFNGLQGTLIFLSFTCKRKIFLQIMKRKDLLFSKSRSRSSENQTNTTGD